MKKRVKKPLIACLAIVFLLSIYAILVYIGFSYINNIYDKLGSDGYFTPKNIPYNLLSKEFQDEITKDEYNSVIDGENAEELFNLFTKMGEITRSFDRDEVYASGDIHRVTQDLIADKYVFKSDEYEYTIYYNLYFVYNEFNPIDVLFKKTKLCGFEIAAGIKKPIQIVADAR